MSLSQAVNQSNIVLQLCIKRFCTKYFSKGTAYCKVKTFSLYFYEVQFLKYSTPYLSPSVLEEAHRTTQILCCAQLTTTSLTFSHVRPTSPSYWLLIKVLCRTRHKIGHFGDVPQANLLAWYRKKNKTKRNNILRRRPVSRLREGRRRRAKPWGKT